MTVVAPATATVAPPARMTVAPAMIAVRVLQVVFMIGSFIVVALGVFHRLPLVRVNLAAVKGLACPV
ncbi:hypothetical protein GCM10009826_29770 [Humibacillus xanthopallidus]